ncbi:ABC transporter substrate-binding protein [Microbacterium sp. NPDC058345]|uniref:ABC transporter substrate-binding protein n=1 Tax=Microbacterium sp. NPDC058345 TaxID=3346455 RepID=UPI003646E3A8
MFRKKRITAAAAVAASAALLLAGCAGGGEPGAGATYDPDEKVTLDFSFWGNDVRADLYNRAIDAFNEEYPNIEVNVSFLDFPAFWEKRQTEAAGGGLPDVMQFDYSYLRQYSENGLLLDLNPYLGGVIDTDPLPESVLKIGVVGDQTTAIPTSTNAWGLFLNPVLLEKANVEAYPGAGSWEDYDAWMSEVTSAAADSGIELWGGTDYNMRIQNFEIYQRAKGEDLFTADGEPNFTEDDLLEFWQLGAANRDDKVVIDQQTLEEISPLSGFDAGLTASELTWDNFGAGYLGNLGEGYTELDLIEPPVTKEGAQDLYLKPSMLHAVAANTDHPEAAVTLLNFLVNSAEVGEIFGTNRGLPASETQLEGAQLDAMGEQIKEYEASIADRLGDAPPVPIVGYGTLEQKFLELGREIGYGTTTPEAAVEQFFTEMDVVVNS